MLTQSDLSQFTGTEHYFRHFGGLLYTDGVKYLADKAGAFWLLDAIASYQSTIMRGGNEALKEYQFWTLEVNTDKSAVLYCQADAGEPRTIEQAIEFTDFPLAQIRLWGTRQDVEGKQYIVLMLPSEY